jgi:RNA polymerase sigma-70 factor (ECF subfamily)
MDSRLIEDRMKLLSPDVREVVILKVWGGLTFDEIATVTGSPATTSFRRYRDGLKELRRSVSPGRKSESGVQSEIRARGA